MKKISLGILAILLSCPLLFAQEERDDWGIWQSINMKASFGKGWNGGLWFEHRSKGNARNLDCALVMPYLSWTPLKYLQIGYASEYIITASGKYLTCRPSVTLMLKSGNLSFNLRELPIYEHSLSSGVGTWTLRTRGKVSWNFPEPRLRPYLSCELFTAQRWKKTRYYAGLEWSFGKRSSLDFFYMYYVMSGLSYQRHILGVIFSISLLDR